MEKRIDNREGNIFKRESEKARVSERERKRGGREREKESAQTFPIALNTKNRFLRKKKPEFFFEKPILVFCWAPRN